MNQKDYKEIAKICKKHSLYTSSAIDLADYFEREDKPRKFHGITEYKGFNREQFLKLCGVE